MILYGLAELNKIYVFQNNNTYNTDFRHLIWCKQSIYSYMVYTVNGDIQYKYRVDRTNKTYLSIIYYAKG